MSEPKRLFSVAIWSEGPRFFANISCITSGKVHNVVQNSLKALMAEVSKVMRKRARVVKDMKPKEKPVIIAPSEDRPKIIVPPNFR
jgi:hypothetical protein